jgi:hypothetical protein
MPAIAAGAKRDGAEFYWHLGDLRAITRPDEDYAHEPEHRGNKNELLAIDEYERTTWDDFVQAQIVPFGEMPFFLGIGNHEVITPKSRAEFIQRFSKWLDLPVLHQQRLADDPHATSPQSYYHWKRDGIDFLYLDNATADQFSPAQLRWMESVLERDGKDPAVHTVVVGMHEAISESIASIHAMDDSERGRTSGRQLYGDLLKLQAAGKKVYVLASHSHFFMDGIFNTEYWRTHGGVLPGWIIGTAGAYRYKLPDHWQDANAAKTNVYGYLLATVSPDGSIHFDFKEVHESDIPPEVATRYTPKFVHHCFVANHE